MKKNIKVSIIIPVYNTVKYLHQCLDSLKNQTLSEIEIICINDGSTDNSLEILNEYAKEDSRFTVIAQENQGQSVARNKGILSAKGEYIGFVDSDDYVALEKFEKLYKEAISKDSDITMCCLKILNEKTGTISLSDPYLTLDLFPASFDNRTFNYSETSEFLFRICVSPCNKIYKRKFLMENNLLFPERLFFEDNAFFYSSFLKAKKISLIRDKLYCYRIISDTSTVFGDDEKKLDFFEIFEKIEELLKGQNLYNEFEDYFQTHKKNTLTYWYKKLNNEKVIKEYEKRFYDIYNDNPC